MRKHFPNDIATEDTREQRRLREEYDTLEGRPVPVDDKPIRITRNELRGIVRSGKKGKATSEDGVPNECMGWVEEEIGEWWCALVNQCMDEGIFPRVWKRANVVWVPKGSGGVRPISLLPALGKVLDRILSRRLSHLMESQGKFTGCQYGFRSGRDTTMAVSRLLESIERNEDRGFHSLVVSLDLKNAFGTAWGPSIVEGMRKKGIGLAYEKIVKSFLIDREIEVEGEEWKMEVGCPQGSSLGPVLWLIVMEDWFESMNGYEREGVNVQAYADDQVVVVSGTSVRKIEEIWERVWKGCEEWARRNRIEYNKSKTEAMFVSKRRVIREPVVALGEVRINTKTSIKYLGIVVDRRRAWLDHTKYIRGKVKSIGGKFLGIAGRKWGRRRETLKTVYEKAICSIVMYGASIWGSKARNTMIRRQLAATERPFLRAITGAYATASTAALAVLAGCVPLCIRAEVAYEAERIYGQGLTGEKVTLKNRPHPALRGWMARQNVNKDDKGARKIWVDGVYRGEEHKGYGCGRCIEGVWETRTIKVSGNCSSNDMEELAILEGVRWGGEDAEDGTKIRIYSDSFGDSGGNI